MIAGGGSTSRPPKADADAKHAQEQDKEKAKAAKAAEQRTERKDKAEERVNARFRAMTGAVVQQITVNLLIYREQTRSKTLAIALLIS